MKTQETEPEAIANLVVQSDSGDAPSIWSRLQTPHGLRNMAATALTIFGVGGPLAETAEASNPSVKVVQTSTNLAFNLTRTRDLSLSSAEATKSGGLEVDVDETKQFQTMKGEGGSLTDSTAYLINNLGPGERGVVMHKLFGRDGAHISVLRLAIGASDYTVSPNPYTYDDNHGRPDPELKHFSIAHDEKYIIPVLKKALAINPHIWIEANTWTMPPWMKANHAYNNIGRRGVLLPKYYPAAANYIAKFIDAYAKHGIHIDAVTPENEPTDPSKYPGMYLSPEGEARFVDQDLVPQLLKGSSTKDTKVYVNDLSWNRSDFEVRPNYARKVLKNTSSTIGGIAWHCYASTPSQQSEFVNYGIDQIEDECSPEHRQNRWAEIEIASERYGSSAAMVWNLALDSNGGPVEPINGCFKCNGLITINPYNSVSYGLKYDQTAQLSKYIMPGAVRIYSTHFVDYQANNPYIAGGGEGLDTIAFKNPDGTTELVANNITPHPISFRVKDAGEAFKAELDANTMATYEWRMPKGK